MITKNQIMKSVIQEFGYEWQPDISGPSRNDIPSKFDLK